MMWCLFVDSYHVKSKKKKFILSVDYNDIKAKKIKTELHAFNLLTPITWKVKEDTSYSLTRLIFLFFFSLWNVHMFKRRLVIYHITHMLLSIVLTLFASLTHLPSNITLSI